MQEPVVNENVFTDLETKSSQLANEPRSATTYKRVKTGLTTQNETNEQA